MPAFTWTTDPDDAKSEQRSMRDLIRLETGLPENLEFRHGLAIGTAFDADHNLAIAVGISFDSTGWYSKKEIVHEVVVDFPYISGLLAFRVGPAVCDLLDAVKHPIDLLLIDGQGISHKRGIGLASHIGVLYNKPSIGVTRKNLYGEYIDPPRGNFNHSNLNDPRSGKPLGYAVSLGEKCEPCFVSPGHLMSIDDSLEIIKKISGADACFPRPLRKAHAIANAESRILPEN